MVSKRILLVDDDETILAPFQLILQNEGYLVDTATTGRQAIEKAEKNEYQMAILDIKLPDIKGIDVAYKMRDLHGEIRLIIITGYPDLADSIETIDIGIDEILMKPIEPDELLRIINETF
jgi:DNA-binding response OmpR family regulator